MKRILMVASVVFVLLLSSSSILIADVIPKNPQLTSATTSSITVKRGEVFTITVGVNAFDGYIFSAGGSFYSTFSYCISKVHINSQSEFIMTLFLISYCEIKKVPSGKYSPYFDFFFL